MMNTPSRLAPPCPHTPNRPIQAIQDDLPGEPPGASRFAVASPCLPVRRALCLAAAGLLGLAGCSDRAQMLEERITQMEKELDRVSGEMRETAGNAAATAETARLQRENGELSKARHDLQTRVDEQEKQLAALRTQVSQLQTRLVAAKPTPALLPTPMPMPTASPAPPAEKVIHPVWREDATRPTPSPAEPSRVEPTPTPTPPAAQPATPAPSPGEKGRVKEHVITW